MRLNSEVGGSILRDVRHDNLRINNEACEGKIDLKTLKDMPPWDWSHVSGLIASKGSEKNMLLAAIGAAAAIRPHEAGMILVDLIHSEDEDIVEAAHEVMAMAEALLEDELDEDEDDASSWRRQTSSW